MARDRSLLVEEAQTDRVRELELDPLLEHLLREKQDALLRIQGLMAAGGDAPEVLHEVMLVAAEVTGFTRYAIGGSVEDGGATVSVLAKGGVARGIPSRAETERRPALRGTKHRAATLREVTVARGASDGRTVVIVPETSRGSVVGITLLHARFADRLSRLHELNMAIFRRMRFDTGPTDAATAAKE